MTPDLRSMAWQTVERVFADLHIAVGSPFPVLLGIEVRKEEMVPPLRATLHKADLETTEAVKKKWPFGRRWFVGAKSQPRPIVRADIERWLDTLEPVLADYDAVLVTWVPQVPAA